MGAVLAWTVVAGTGTGERFSDFAPYVPAIDDACVVAFQAALHGGDSGVFLGDGRDVQQVVAPPEVAEVTSHPERDRRPRAAGRWPAARCARDPESWLKPKGRAASPGTRPTRPACGVSRR